MEPAPESTNTTPAVPAPGFHRRLRAWGLFGAALALWLLTAYRTGLQPEGWPTPFVAWSGGQPGSSGGVSRQAPLAAGGTRLHETPDDAFLRLPSGGSVELGRLSGDRPWMVSAWYRLPAGPDGGPPSATLASLTGPELRLHLSLRHGRPILECWNAEGGELPKEPLRAGNPSTIPIPPARWFHLAWILEGASAEVRLDGVPVLRMTGKDGTFPHSGNLRLEGGASPVPVEATGARRAGTVPDAGPEAPVACEIDDVALLEPLPGPEGIGLLHSVGRGALPRRLDAGARSERILDLGIPVFVVALALLSVVSLAGLARRLLAQMFRPLHRPSTWMLAGGLLLTAVAATFMSQREKRTEQERFLAHVHRLSGELKARLGQHGQLLGEFREWIASGTRRTPDEVRAWIHGRRLEESPIGFLGIGQAERVPSDPSRDVETVWSRIHRFPFRIEPAPAPSDPFPDTLEGRPRLPVVLFQPRGLHEVFWRTNGSILGRDLLRARSGLPDGDQGPRQVARALASGKTTGGLLRDAIPDSWFGEPRDCLRMVAPLGTSRPADPNRIRPEEWTGIVFLLVDPERLLGDLGAAGNPEFAFALHPALGTAKSAMAHAPSAARGSPTAWDRRRVPGPGVELDLETWTTPEFDRHSSLGNVHWIVAGGLLLTLLATVLLRVQDRAAERSKEMNQRIQSANRRLAQSDRERARLSRDLHDGTVQNLYAVGLHLQHALRHLESNPDRSREGVEAGHRLVQETLVELREFLLTLKDEPSSQRTLADLLEGLVGRLRRTLPIQVDLEIRVDTRPLSRRSVLHLTNLVREAVSNALRHADPARITIRLLPGKIPGWMYLEVADDGRGFDLSKSRRDGFGMVTLLERASELRGALSLDSKPGHGTVLRLQFPEKPGEESSL